jgi:predicted lipoprotein with Yx(FWY)xxD motif
MTRTIRRFVAAVAPLALVLVAAACGGSGTGSTPSAALNGSAAPTSAATGAARISAANSTLGRIVVDGSARTLYLFEKDTNGHSACYGPCATYWPPLLSKGQPVAGPGATQSLLGTIQRADGSNQVTYAGHPLYTYINDTKPGQTTGEGSQLFGAGWDALSPLGQKIEADG